MYMLIFFLFISLTHSSNTFFEDEWKARSTPVFDSFSAKEANNGIVSQVFKIDINDTIASVLPTIWGNNSNFYLYNILKNPAALDHLRATGLKNMRLPGGNVTNTWLWDNTIRWQFWDNYKSKIKSGPTKKYNVMTQEQLTIADSIGAMPQPCINIALARFIKGSDSIQKAASYAADWVRQWNIKENRNVKYWEIGNENYGSWSAGYIVNGDTINGTMYGNIFNVIADSMKAVDPTIKVGAVVFEGESNNWTGEWNQDVLPIVQNHADYLVVHQYFTFNSNPNNITVDQMIDALPLIEETKSRLQRHVENHTNKSKDFFPIAMTEYNVRAGKKNSQQISAVFNAMAIGEYTKHQYGLVNIWNIANSFNNADDHGMLTRLDPNRSLYDPNPTFYAYYLTQLYFGDKLLKVSPDNSNGIHVYPTQFKDGDLGVLVVNASASAQTIELDLDSFDANGEIYSHHLTSSGAESREVFLNGISGGSNSGPLNYAEIKPFKATFTKNPILSTEPYSVNTYILKQNVTTVNLAKTLIQNSQTKVIKLLPNQKKLAIETKPQNIAFFSLNGDLIDVKWRYQNGFLYFERTSESVIYLNFRN
jgi:alpha-L-arabinofuranosidase